jgi:hypothetical protein
MSGNGLIGESHQFHYTFASGSKSIRPWIFESYI